MNNKGEAVSIPLCTFRLSLFWQKGKALITNLLI
jgi:hypothetical protein